MTPIQPLHQIPSLCIPKVDKSIREKDVRDVFKKLNFGLVERIDIVSWKTTTNTNTNTNKFSRVFVHFKTWNESAEELRADLLNGYTYNIVHNFPWYWKVVASRLPKPIHH